MPDDSQDRPSLRRMPSVPRKVSEIGAGDVRVSVIGTLIDRQGNIAVIDDGTGQVRASFEKEPQAELNGLVRVFGRVIPLEGGFELQAEIMQDMSDCTTRTFRRLQSPGQPKTVSTIMLPPSSAPVSSAATVTVGMSAFFSA